MLHSIPGFLSKQPIQLEKDPYKNMANHHFHFYQMIIFT